MHDLPLAKVGYEAKCKYGVRFVLDLHENWPVLLQLSKHTNTFLGKLLSSNAQWIDYEKKMCGLADKINVVVDEAKGRINGLGVALDKIEVVSNTLDMNQFDPIERKEFKTDKFKMLYVGGINYHRGIQYVIQAISLLKKKGIEVHFDLVGDGSYLADIKQLINELIPQVVDLCLHNMLCMFEEHEDFVISIDEENLNDLSDGLAGELYSADGWISRFSEQRYDEY